MGSSSAEGGFLSLYIHTSNVETVFLLDALLLDALLLEVYSYNTRASLADAASGPFR